MKKSDLVDSISLKHKLPKAQAQQLLDDVLSDLAEALARGDKIDLRGFGTFTVRDSKERTGRNPQTDEPLVIPARRVPGFKAGKALKDRCNELLAKP